MPRSRIAVILAAVAVFMGHAWHRSASAADAQPIPFTQETLDNGLRVIYAPLHQAPVVHVRVLYHVGSRDERPDRQGFAHMFEHMMFRGSAHVKPEEHMKLVGTVGGYCNAFTSFDETVYVNTLPSEHLDMALYLEADRMASFKVSEDIYKTERKVVAEEWRMGQNQPYGTLYQEFLKVAFVAHSYQWTPIGNMEHLKAAAVDELQEFFNKYYVPNNAVLVVAGDFDPEAAKASVHRYFNWIPRGAAVERSIPAEPPQDKLRHAVTPQRVPLAAVVVGYHIPAYRSDDQYPLGLLGSILAGGRSGRLQKMLVDNATPQCVDVGAGNETLEDGGIFNLFGMAMVGRNPDVVEKSLFQAVADVCEKGVTQEELDKVRATARVAAIHERETADKLAGQLGMEALLTGDPNRVNTELAKLDAVTVADIQAVARKYLQPQMATVLLVKPDPLGKETRNATTQAAETINAPVHANKPIVGRDIKFPADYPTAPVVSPVKSTPHFQKGDEFTVNGVRVIVMADHRLPTVNWNLTMRRGAHSEPQGKEGTSTLAAEMVRRGTTAQTYAQLNQDLESKGIAIGVTDGGDYTRLSGSCTSENLDLAVQRSREVLLEPRFDKDEFARVKEQMVNQLLQEQESPGDVAGLEIKTALYGNSVFGRYATPASVQTIILDDVKQYYQSIYKPNDAVLIFAGDVSVEKGKELATKLLQGWQPGPQPEVNYTLPPAPQKRRIILVDRPEGKGVTLQMAIPAYTVHSDDKYAGSLASQILTAGIDSRLGKYVRAQKGLVYSIHGVFSPHRHTGRFTVSTDTRPEAAAETIEAAFKVLNDMCNAEVTPLELAESKLRVAGGMVMGMQTIQSQAGMRIDGILNDYPLDYYDQYPQRIAGVTAAQVREVMQKYVTDSRMVIVVVAPASLVKAQLEKLGTVEVLPMPAKRTGATSQPSREMLKPAA